VKSKVVDFNGESIQSITTSGDTSMLLTDANAVYVWGHNAYIWIPAPSVYIRIRAPAVYIRIIRYGQCGQGHMKDLLYPRLVRPFGPAVELIACGKHHVIAACGPGQVHKDRCSCCSHKDAHSCCLPSWAGVVLGARL